jgi:hypothetical protein
MGATLEPDVRMLYYVLTRSQRPVVLVPKSGPARQGLQTMRRTRTGDTVAVAAADKRTNRHAHMQRRTGERPSNLPRDDDDAFGSERSIRFQH